MMKDKQTDALLESLDGIRRGLYFVALVVILGLSGIQCQVASISDKVGNISHSTSRASANLNQLNETIQRKRLICR